jgi:hypothetical protein
LHDELIVVAAPWFETERKGHLVPKSSKEDEQAVRDIEQALLALPAKASKQQKSLERSLLPHAANDFGALWRYVTQEADARALAAAQERVTSGPEGLVRIALKRAFSDGTVAVDLDPLSLLSRLVAAVPAPRFHTVRYAGVLGSASKLRARIVPSRARQAVASEGPPEAPPEDPSDAAGSPRRPRYRPWAELLKRTFGFDVLCCPTCGARMRLLAMVTEPKSITRYLRTLGEPEGAPARSPPRGPPYWKSRALRRTATTDHAAE